MEAIVHFCEKGCFWRKLLNWKNKLKESHLTSHCKRIWMSERLNTKNKICSIVYWIK